MALVLSVFRWEVLLTGNGCLDQTGHNDFQVKLNTSPGFFAIVTARESARLWVCPGSHQYVHYDDKSKRDLADLLVMNEITIPSYSIFIGQGHLQHAGTGWRGSHCLRYHMYLIPRDNPITDNIHYAYGWGLRRETESKTSHNNPYKNALAKHSSKNTDGGKGNNSDDESQDPDEESLDAVSGDEENIIPDEVAPVHDI